MTSIISHHLPIHHGDILSPPPPPLFAPEGRPSSRDSLRPSHRLLSLRRRMESGDHKYSRPDEEEASSPPPSHRDPPTKDDRRPPLLVVAPAPPVPQSFATPPPAAAGRGRRPPSSPSRSPPSPPKPGRRPRLALPMTFGGEEEEPRFLPAVGLGGAIVGADYSVPPPPPPLLTPSKRTRSAAAVPTTPLPPSALRPRFECPWLAGLLLPPSPSSGDGYAEEEEEEAAGAEKGGAAKARSKTAVSLDLLDKLRSASLLSLSSDCERSPPAADEIAKKREEGEITIDYFKASRLRMRSSLCLGTLDRGDDDGTVKRASTFRALRRSLGLGTVGVAPAAADRGWEDLNIPRGAKVPIPGALPQRIERQFQAMSA